MLTVATLIMNVNLFVGVSVTVTYGPVGDLGHLLIQNRYQIAGFSIIHELKDTTLSC